MDEIRGEESDSSGSEQGHPQDESRHENVPTRSSARPYGSRDELYDRNKRFDEPGKASSVGSAPPVNPLTEDQHRELVLRFLSYAKAYSAPHLTRDQLHDRD
jgi:hypothetical protein